MSPIVAETEKTVAQALKDDSPNIERLANNVGDSQDSQYGVDRNETCVDNDARRPKSWCVENKEPV